MAEPTDPPQREHEIDWEDTRARLRERIRSQLGRCEDAVLDDLTQQASISVLRTVRRDGVHNLGGLVAAVGKGVAIEEIRRRQRERARRVQGDPSHLEMAHLHSPGLDHWGDSAELLWFLLLEFFRVHRAPCYELAVLYAEKGDWNAVAHAMNKSSDSIRQQWSRCTRFFRASLKRNPGPFEDWLGNDG